MLNVIAGPAAGAHVTIRHGDMLMVGRASECGLALPADEELSRLHFSIVSKEEGFAIRDLNSANHTHRDEAPIEEVALEHGDEIQAGQSTFLVTLSHLEDEEAAELPSDATEIFDSSGEEVAVHLTDLPPPRRIRANSLLLLVIDGPHKGEQHLVDQGHAEVLGRSSEATIRFSRDEAMSRIHCSVDFTNKDAPILKDLGSANGTRVNRRKVLSSWLKNGDMIQAGDSIFHLQFQGHPRSWATLEDENTDGSITGFRNLRETLMIRRNTDD